MANNNNNNWKRIGGFSRTGTQNYVRTNDTAMGGTTFGSTDVSNNVGNTTLRIGNNAGVIYINGDIDMSGGANVGAPINRIRNVRDPSANQDVATKFYVDTRIAVISGGVNGYITGPTGPEGPPGIGIAGTNGSAGPIGYTGPTGPLGATGSSFGVKGPTGDRGGTGSTGANGAAGATGPIGPVGEKGEQGTEGTQGIQGSNGTILWLNPDGDSPTNQLITDSYLLSKVPINASVRTVGPISVSATYGNVNKIIPASRFFNTAIEVSTLAVIPSGVWVLNLYANVPSNSDANQVALYAAVFMISGTTNQPSPDSLVIETKDGGDAGYYPPRAAYLPDHVKYIGKSWASTDNVLTSNTDTANKGAIIDGTSRKLYKVEMPVEFITLKDASGNRENVYVQLQIYIRNTKEANQTANVSLYFQTDATTNETTYSYLQTTFGAVGIQGIPGSTGSTGAKGDNGLIGPAGPAGATGSAGPTGIAGPVGPRGSQGPTGVTGPAGSSNSYGVQHAVQYRGNGTSTSYTDTNGNFLGDTNFRYIPTGYTPRLTDASAGSVVLNDLACNSIHSPVYVQDATISGSGTTRPRTYIRGGELVNSGPSAEQSNYVVLASGTDTTNGSNSKIAASVNDITNGVKMIHNFDTKKVIFQVHDGDKLSGTVGLQFDLNGATNLGNISAAQDQFCIVRSSGAVGVGGITASQLSSSTYNALNRMLHVRGNIMVGLDPGSATADLSAGMVLLNKATTTPTGTLSGYPGIYHRKIANSTEATGLGGSTNNSIAAADEGLGFISPNFITFQTGSTLQNNSIVINNTGVVSVTGRTNLNGAVSVNKNFATVETHDNLAPVMDISGTLSVSTGADNFTDVPRIKLISRGIAAGSSIPSVTSQSQPSTSNEIRGVSSNSSTSGFLRLSAQTPANSCIDLIGRNENPPSTPTAYNNAVRISTGGIERMIVNGSGNVGIGTNAPTVPLEVVGNAIVRNSVRIGSTTAPTVALDVVGAAKVSTILSAQTGLILGDNTKTAMESHDGPTTSGSLLNMHDGTKPRMEFKHPNNRFGIGCSDAEAFIWSYNTKPIVFGTSNNHRMTITTSGNVGIGIQAPTSLLHVAGAAKITGDASISTATIGSTSDANVITNTYDSKLAIYHATAPKIYMSTSSSAVGGLLIGKDTVRAYVDNRESGGELAIVTEQNIPIVFKTNAANVSGGWGTNRMIINGGGDIVMGNNPESNSSFLLNGGGSFTNYQGRVTLVVKPLSNPTQNRPYYRNTSTILYADGNGFFAHGSTGFNNDGDPLSGTVFGGNFVAFFEGAIQCDFIIIASDKRMKKNITEINNDKPLQLLRKIKCSTFEYIDKIKNTTYTVHGFIAQDIKDVVPESVHTVTDFLPNFYCNCIVEKHRVDKDSKKQIYRVFVPENPSKQLIFTGNHDIYGTEYKTTTGMPASDALGNQMFVVKLYDSSNNEINVETIKIIDEYSFLISVKLNEKGENDKITEEMYFLYGQQVDDFHKIDNDHIHNIATAALQEVDRQQQVDKARIAELENQVSNLEATVASQQSLINDILERLKSNGM